MFCVCMCLCVPVYKMLVCWWVHVCVQVNMCVCACMWRPEDNLTCHFRHLSQLVQDKVFHSLELHQVGYTRQPLICQESACLCFSLCHCWDCKGMLPCLPFYVGSRGLESGPHIYKVSVLLNELFSQFFTPF